MCAWVSLLYLRVWIAIFKTVGTVCIALLERVCGVLTLTSDRRALPHSNQAFSKSHMFGVYCFAFFSFFGIEFICSRDRMVCLALGVSIKYCFISFLFLMAEYASLTHFCSLFLSQSWSSGLPAYSAGGSGGEWLDGDSGEQRGDMASGISTQPHSDQWGSDHHPSSTARPWRDCAIGNGKKEVVLLLKFDTPVTTLMFLWDQLHTTLKVDVTRL